MPRFGRSWHLCGGCRRCRRKPTRSWRRRRCADRTAARRPGARAAARDLVRFSGAEAIMKSLGARSKGARLERMQASPQWAADRFRNVHPIMAGLRDPNVAMPSLTDFLCGGVRRVPRGPLPARNPLASWAQAADSGLRVTWLGHSTVCWSRSTGCGCSPTRLVPRASPSRLAGPKRFQPVPGAAALNAFRGSRDRRASNNARRPSRTLKNEGVKTKVSSAVWNLWSNTCVHSRKAGWLN